MRLKRNHWAAATIGWAAILLIVSVIPGQDLPSVTLWEGDKLFHALFYGVLTFFLYRYLLLRTPSSQKIKSVIRSAVLCILFGFLIELIQLILPTRSFDWLDELANCIGCGVVIMVFIISHKGTKNTN